VVSSSCNHGYAQPNISAGKSSLVEAVSGVRWQIVCHCPLAHYFFYYDKDQCPEGQRNVYKVTLPRSVTARYAHAIYADALWNVQCLVMPRRGLVLSPYG
jgi:hypothetical protein